MKSGKKRNRGNRVATRIYFVHTHEVSDKVKPKVVKKEQPKSGQNKKEKK